MTPAVPARKWTIARSSGLCEWLASFQMRFCANTDQKRGNTELGYSKVAAGKIINLVVEKSVPIKYDKCMTYQKHTGELTSSPVFSSWTLVRAARHARHRKPPAQRVEGNFRYATKNLPPSMRIVQVIMPREGR